MDWEELWWCRRAALLFSSQPVHVFVLEGDGDQSPAALILTTHDEPGNPEQHRKSEFTWSLMDSDETVALALVPDELATASFDLEAADEIIDRSLMNQAYGLDKESGVFCICRINGFFGEASDGPITVYMIEGGYMLQFNHEYSFAPQEMDHENHMSR